MRRREFITLLGGAAAAWPLAARAQQPSAMRRIGVLMNGRRTNPEAQARITAFGKDCGGGWAVGRNVRIDIPLGRGDTAPAPRTRRNWSRSAPDVIVAGAAPIPAALQQATRTVPIVFVSVTDPVGGGFVESLARPGGNTTGFMQYRVRPERKMARAAQADGAARTRVGCQSGDRTTGWLSSA